MTAVKERIIGAVSIMRTLNFLSIITYLFSSFIKEKHRLQ